MARSRSGIWLLAALPAFIPFQARASFLQGDALDAMANAISWVVLFLVPAFAIALFWFVHIIPEKVARKRQHPQAKAIQCLCLLSLVFGGLLWPFALLWAYTKPVLYKIAYGTDTVPHEPAPAAPGGGLPPAEAPAPAAPEDKA